MSKARLLLVGIVWLVILGLGVGAWKFLFADEVAAKQAEEERVAQEEAAAREAEARRRGGADSRYKTAVTINLDAFSGYAVLRSDPFKDALRESEIRLELVDDGADYPARLDALAKGTADMAVFTIDALVKASAQAGALPATIVAVIDESTGADAILGAKATLQNVAALNDPQTKFVVVPDSPSETLARVVMSRFDLDRLGEDPFVRADSAADVFARYKQSKPADRLAFVLWEPYVTQTLKNPAMHVLADSGEFPAAIVDVLVASDDFVAKSPEVVSEVLRSYFVANHAYGNDSARVTLVQEDAEKLGEPLSDEEAARLVDGIWWKNTPENLAHMGIAPDRGVTHVEDIIDAVTDVLLESGGIADDPTGGRPNYLFNTAVWSPLADFRPRGYIERIRGRRLPKLSDEQWQTLSPAGIARAPKLSFARGTARLTSRSQVLMDEMIGRLNSTRYYVRVEGNADARGDAEANRRLAEARAKTVEAYLRENGVDANRVRAEVGEVGRGTSVTFVLGVPR